MSDDIPLSLLMEDPQARPIDGITMATLKATVMAENQRCCTRLAPLGTILGLMVAMPPDHQVIGSMAWTLLARLERLLGKQQFAARLSCMLSGLVAEQSMPTDEQTHVSPPINADSHGRRVSSEPASAAPVARAITFALDVEDNIPQARLSRAAKERANFAIARQVHGQNASVTPAPRLRALLAPNVVQTSAIRYIQQPQEAPQADQRQQNLRNVFRDEFLDVDDPDEFEDDDEDELREFVDERPIQQHLQAQSVPSFPTTTSSTYNVPPRAQTPAQRVGLDISSPAVFTDGNNWPDLLKIHDIQRILDAVRSHYAAVHQRFNTECDHHHKMLRLWAGICCTEMSHDQAFMAISGIQQVFHRLQYLKACARTSDPSILRHHHNMIYQREQLSQYRHLDDALEADIRLRERNNGTANAPRAASQTTEATRRPPRGRRGGRGRQSAATGGGTGRGRGGINSTSDPLN